MTFYKFSVTVHARDAAFTEEAAGVHEDDMAICKDLRDGRLAEQLHGCMAEDYDGIAMIALRRLCQRAGPKQRLLFLLVERAVRVDAAVREEESPPRRYKKSLEERPQGFSDLEVKPSCFTYQPLATLIIAPA